MEKNRIRSFRVEHPLFLFYFSIIFSHLQTAAVQSLKFIDHQVDIQN